MAATRYTVAATANHPARTMANLKAAKAAADRRAAADGETVQVVTVATGRVSYTAEAPAAPAADLFEEIIAEVKAEREAEIAETVAAAQDQLAEALLPVVKAPRKATRREGLGEAAVPGWELLYDKPRQGCQVGRKDGQYALICTAHGTVRPVGKLVEERAVRKAGGWCPDCQH